MSEKEKSIINALKAAHAIEQEKLKAIMDSVRAIHGETAHNVLQAAYNMLVQQFVQIRALAVVAHLSDAQAMETVTQNAGRATREFVWITVHLATTGSVPTCTLGACNYHPKALDLMRMLDVLLDMHMAEAGKAAAIVIGLMDK